MAIMNIHPARMGGYDLHVGVFRVIQIANITVPIPTYLNSGAPRVQKVDV